LADVKWASAVAFNCNSATKMFGKPCKEGGIDKAYFLKKIAWYTRDLMKCSYQSTNSTTALTPNSLLLDLTIQPLLNSSDQSRNK